MQLTSDQTQVILGTLLGNSRLERDESGLYLLMKSRDEMWLRSKSQILSNFGQCSWTSRGNFYWRSVSNDAIFGLFDDLIYDGEFKKIRMSCLDKLNFIGVMTWYGDIGCLVGRTKMNACLRVQAFQDTANTACQFFNEVGVSCRINNVRGKPVIVFTLDGTKRLMYIIEPVLPQNRYHLVPTKAKQ